MAKRFTVKVGGQTIATTTTKQPAIEIAKKQAKADPVTTQVVIKKQDGTIQTEHTYPRSKDPRRSPG